MHKNKFALAIFVAALVLSMLACSVGAQPTATPVPTNTPAPTNTPVPTNTPEPTKAPEPTETVAPPPAKDTEVPKDTEAPKDGGNESGLSEVEDGTVGILALSNWKTDGGYWVITGLVINKTDQAVDSLEIEIEVFDANDKSLYKETTWSDLYTLAPGSTSPFSLWVSEDDITDPDHYVATIVGQSQSDASAANVEIVKVTEVTDDYGYVYLTGEVVNNGSEPALVNGLAGAIFDAAGELVTGESSGVYMHYIDPGDSGPFRISITAPADADLSDYTIYVDASVTEQANYYDFAFGETQANYLDSFGNFHLVGNLTNSATETLNVSMIAALLDADGNVIDVASGYIPYYAIEAGETLAYDVDGWATVNYIDGYYDEKAASYHIWVDYYWAYSSSYEFVTMSSKDDDSLFKSDSATFTGSAVNNSTETLENVIVVVTLNNKETGMPYATEYAYIDEDELAPDASGLYEITMWLPDGFDKDSVDVVVTVKGTKK
jgi:hypothetical protein